MFKRSLASLAVVAVASGAVVAPANAVTVTVNNDMCTFRLTAEEADFTGLNSPVSISKDKATLLKTQYGETQLSALRAEIEADKKKLDTPGLNSVEQQKLRKGLEEKRKRLTANENFRKALDECIAGRNYNSDKPGGPKRPERPNTPPERPNTPPSARIPPRAPE